MPAISPIGRSFAASASGILHPRQDHRLIGWIIAIGGLSVPIAPLRFRGAGTRLCPTGARQKDRSKTRSVASSTEVEVSKVLVSSALLLVVPSPFVLNRLVEGDESHWTCFLDVLVQFRIL